MADTPTTDTTPTLHPRRSDECGFEDNSEVLLFDLRMDVPLLWHAARDAPCVRTGPEHCAE